MRLNPRQHGARAFLQSFRRAAGIKFASSSKKNGDLHLIHRTTLAGWTDWRLEQVFDCPGTTGARHAATQDRHRRRWTGWRIGGSLCSRVDPGREDRRRRCRASAGRKARA
jgi:hypothetical protein